jgi:hypothetical protein
MKAFHKLKVLSQTENRGEKKAPQGREKAKVPADSKNQSGMG